MLGHVTAPSIKVPDSASPDLTPGTDDFRRLGERRVVVELPDRLPILDAEIDLLIQLVGDDLAALLEVSEDSDESRALPPRLDRSPS